MGTLPPNIASEDPQRFPAARSVELRRRPVQFTDGPAASFSAAIPNFVNPWFSNAVFPYFNEVAYDYQSSVSRVGGTAGSGPYLRGGPGDGFIFVTAPLDRPLPYIAWSHLLLANRTIAASASLRSGIARSNPSNFSVDYRLLDEWNHSAFTPSQGPEYYTVNCFGFDVVPPGQSYRVWCGSDAPSSSIPFYYFDDGGTPDLYLRHHFGVMTF